MNVTQYTTAADRTFFRQEMQPMGCSLNGIKTLAVSETPRPGKWQGFGVAITGSSCYLLNKMDPESRAAFLADVYTPAGLDLQVGRISVGSSDYSPYVYSYDDVPDDRALRHFSIKRDKEFILPMLRQVLAVKPSLYLFSSPWSPPGWMKTGGSLGGGFMRRAYLDVYADYYVKFLKAYAQQGITIRALTPQNESETDQAGRMLACLWHPELEAEFAILLRQKLDEAGLPVKIWLYDHNFQNTARVLWSLKEYPALQKAVDGIAFHYYDGNVEKLDEITETYPGLTCHFTEGGPRLYDHYADDWCKWGIMMNKAMNHGCRSFSGWNLLLDEKGGPNVGPFFCGGLATLHNDTGELTFSGQYRALRHFSHFVKPGAEIYDCGIRYDGISLFGFNRDSMPSPLSASWVKNPDGSTVIHLVNANASKQQVQFCLNGQWWYVECLPDSLSSVVITP